MIPSGDPASLACGCYSAPPPCPKGVQTAAVWGGSPGAWGWGFLPGAEWQSCSSPLIVTDFSCPSSSTSTRSCPFSMILWETAQVISGSPVVLVQALGCCQTGLCPQRADLLVVRSSPCTRYGPRRSPHLRVVMRCPWTKVVDVETERKALAPGLKEKDEEENSGIGAEEERLLKAAAVPVGQEPLCPSTPQAPDAPARRLGKATEAEMRGSRTAFENRKVGQDSTYRSAQGRRKRRRRRGLSVGSPGSEALRRGPGLLQQ